MLTVVFARGLDFPLNIVAAAGTVAAFGYVIWRVVRYDFQWVELDGTTIRAKHFYSRKTVERTIEEIDELGVLVVRRVD